MISLLRLGSGSAVVSDMRAAEGSSAEEGTGRSSRAGRLAAPPGDAGERSSGRPSASPSASPSPAPEPSATVESKRNFRTDDFTSPGLSLEDYRMEGLVRTPAGITLAPLRDDQKTSDPDEPVVRKGVLESPPLVLDFPSNYMMPLWRQELTEGGGVTVEMSISPDGGQWSRWFALEPTGDEISPTYPDGSPNPNYGYIGGTGIANGTRLYSLVKYRVTLTSGDPKEAPVVNAFRIYHNDTTGTSGVPAERAYTAPDAPASPESN